MSTPKKLTKEAEAEAKEFFGEEVIKPWREANKVVPVGRRFKPGKTGNPGGRPRTPEGVTEVLAWRLGKNGAKLLAEKLIKLATGDKPDLRAIQYIYDRLDGKPRQSVETINDGEDPFILLLQRLYEPENKDTVEGRTITIESPSEFESLTEAEIRETDS